VRLESERLRGGFSEELKNPNPVSGADPSILRDCFHPNASKGSALALHPGFSSIKTGLNWSN
jgi:hypothetical protein